MKRLLSFVTLLAAASSYAFASNHLWDMTAWKTALGSQSITSGTASADGLTYYGQEKSAFDANTKEFADGTKWATRLKLGGASTLNDKSASRVFSFEADKGDVVTLYVVHGSSTGTRTAYLSAERSTDKAKALLEVPTVDGGTGTAKVTLTADGTYYVWADNNVGISCIRVDGIPAEYDNVKAVIVDTRNEWNAIAKEVAEYAVGNLTALFTGLNTQLNDKAKTIDEVEAELEALLKEHQAGGDLDWTWAEKEAELTGKLTALNLGAFQLQLKNIEPMNLEGYYDDIKEAADSIAKLTVANAKTWAADSLGGEVTDSLETVINSIAAACAQGALASSTQFDGDLAKVSDLVDNVLMRASEQDSITRAAVVATDTLQVARGIVASLEGQEFAAALLPSYKAGLDKIEAAMTALQAEADKDTLRLRGYESKIAEWTKTNDNNIKAVGDTIAKYNGLLNEAAYKFQSSLADTVQKVYDDYYFRISAKYENEPDVQKDYQQQFAKIQVKLSGVDETIEKRYEEKKSVEYNQTAIDTLGTIRSEIEQIWKNAQVAQDQAIIAANDSLYGEWKELNDSLHATYVNYIKNVEVYKTIAATAEDASIANVVKDAESKLFPELDSINSLNDAAGAAYTKANQDITYFDLEGFSNKADKVFGDMKAIVTGARESVNQTAYDVYDEKVTSWNGYKYLVQGAINKIKSDFPEAHSYATDSLENVCDSIDNVTAIVTRLYNNKTLPDSLDYCLAQLAYVPAAVNYLVAEAEAHNGVAETMKELTAYWTVAWSGKTEATAESLQAIYDEITALQGKVAESVGKMVESREALEAEAETLYNKVFKYADPEAYAANEAAHTAITTAISELSDKLDSVATVISGYSEAVKAEYGYRAENIEEAIGNLSAEVEEAYTARTIAEQQEELTARAEALSALVGQLAAEAAAAEEAATRVEGDLNGDGTVDASDFELLWPYVESDENPAEYDLNGDGVVDIVDVTILSNIYGAAE